MSAITLDAVMCEVVNLTREVVCLKARVARLEGRDAVPDHAGPRPASHGLEMALLKLGAAVAASEASKRNAQTTG